MQIMVTTHLGQQETVEIDRWPDECPQCHYHLQPKYLSGYSVRPHKQVFAFQCTRDACREVFLGHYEHRYLRRTTPRAPSSPSFSDEVKAVSPDFIEIYTQAMAAEIAGLDQLTGIGLRKALEFLIKDFLVLERPADAEKIKSTFLGPCIKQFVEDTNVKVCAERAAWLGNDETHYVRKWTTHDIDDLKTLVRLTANWIESVRLTRKYTASMPAQSR